MKCKVLIVGGYGTFGGRLVDLLLDQKELTLLVGGRRLEAAETFCKMRAGKAGAVLVPQQVSRANAVAAIVTHKPDIVVDASGPFQVYGGDPYSLVKATIAGRCHYLDLADGADFVQGIAAYEDAAKHAGVFVLSGLSSFPVLTAAVGRVLAKDLDVVQEIVAGIAPSPYAGVGLNVVKAIASYAGQGVEVLQDGKWVRRAGFIDSRQMQVNVPGKVPLRPIRFALAEVPDLKVLPSIWLTARDVWIGAGPTPSLLHRLLWAAAGLVKLGLLKSLLPLAPIMNLVVNNVRWGEHRGGFVMQMGGLKNAEKKHLSWHLLAEGDGGPLIPSMAVAAIIINFMNGKQPAVGARSGHGDLELSDYQFWFDRFGIATGRREIVEGLRIYEEVLGEGLGRLDAPVREFHGVKGSFKVRGEAHVTGGSSLLAGIVRQVFGFPAPQSHCPVEVDIDVSETGELWQRRFDGKPMKSFQELGRGHNAGLIIERFGPVAVAMAVVEDGGRLELRLRGWRFFGVPLPKSLLPYGKVYEHGAGGRFNFHVEVKLPIIGHIVTYEGWLKPI